MKAPRGESALCACMVVVAVVVEVVVEAVLVTCCKVWS